MEERVRIVDTTLEEGERAPGCNFTLDEKLRIARQLELLRPDVIEAGSPMKSPVEFEAVRLVARTVEACGVAARCGLSRADIARAWEAVQHAKHPVLHISLALKDHSAGVRLWDDFRLIGEAKSFCPEVQVSFECAPDYPVDTLCEGAAAALKEGATVVGLPDTRGHATPEEYGELFGRVGEHVQAPGKCLLSARCANDLGLATANALAAIRNGSRQVECTVNGIGARAGTIALEEIVMLLESKRRIFALATGVHTPEIHKSSKLVESLSGMPVQRHKAVVGANAFASEGSPADAVTPEPVTDGQLTPAAIGLKRSTLFLGKDCDKSTLGRRYAELGYALTPEQLEKAYGAFRQIAEVKKEVFDDDLTAILETAPDEKESFYHLEKLQVHSGTSMVPTATVELRKGDEKRVDSATGDGPVDAAYKAIERITGVSGKLTEYLIKSVSFGRDGIGEVFVHVDFQGVQFRGRGLSTDIITGSARAYLEAVNRVLAVRERSSQEKIGPLP